MCQSIADGGRRCDCLSGSERRRVRQRARYHAKKQEAAHEATSTIGGVSPLPLTGDVPDMSDVDLSTVTIDTLLDMPEQERSALRERCREGLVAARAKRDTSWAICLSETKSSLGFDLSKLIDVSTEEISANPYWYDTLSKEDQEKLFTLASGYNYDDVTSPAADSYTQAVIDAGDNLRVASLISAMERNEEMLRDVDFDRIYAGDVPYFVEVMDKYGTGLTNAEESYGDDLHKAQQVHNNLQKIAQQHQEKGTQSIEERIAAGHAIPAGEFADYVAQVYGVEPARRGKKTYIGAGAHSTALHYSELKTGGDVEDVDSSLFALIDEKGTQVEKLAGKSWYYFQSSSRFYDKDNDDIRRSFPATAEGQQHYLQSLHDRYIDSKSYITDRRNGTVADLINSRFDRNFIDAIQAESGADFHSQDIDIIKSSAAFSSEPLTAQAWQTAVGCYPASLIDSANRRNPVGVQLKISEKQRSFFVDKDRVERREQKKVLMSFRKHSGQLDHRNNLSLDEDSIFSHKWIADNRDTISDDDHYNFIYSDYPEVGSSDADTLTAEVEKYNSGKTGYKFFRSGKGRSVIPVSIEERTDPRGVQRLVPVGDDRKITTVIAPTIVTERDKSTMLHELGHYLERDPQVWIATNNFLNRRTKSQEEKIYHKSQKHGVEKTIADGFYSDYVGKNYEGRASTEVFTMGMEALVYPRGKYSRKNSSFMDRANFSPVGSEIVPEAPKVRDTEHLNLILGLLGTHRRW